MIKKLVKKEVEAFNIFNADAKKLIIINLIYSLAFPFIIIFGSAFIMRVTNGNNTLAIVYNWGFFLGLILGYFINGKLLKHKYDIRNVFTVGVFLTVVPLSLLMFFGKDAGYYVIFYGLLVGTGNGIYWSCRNMITLQVTNDDNRNFFASLEQFIIIFCNALIPLLFGTFILGSDPGIEFKMTAYKYTSVVVVLITLVAGILILKSNFKTPPIKRFVYFRFGKIWNYQRTLTFTVGMVEAGFMVLMTLLILNVAGDESVLGKIEFFTAIVSVISIYIVGRIAKPKHRGKIMLAGAISLIIGGTFLAFTITNEELLFNFLAISFLGVIIMKIGQVIADPMVHSSFRATFLTSIDKSSIAENRDSYSFIMDNEYFMNGGRIFGGIVFVLITYYINDITALRYTFIILALIQLISAFLVNKLAFMGSEKTENAEAVDPQKEAPVSSLEKRA
jgi:MFS transporter, YQGE family, putative transporter